MPPVKRAEVAAKVKAVLAGIPPEQLLPMPHNIEGLAKDEGERTGKISKEEWEEYRQRRQCYYKHFPEYLDGFKRPPADMANDVWNFLGAYTRHYIDPHEWLPRRLELSFEEETELRLIQRQAFLIVFDLFVAAAEPTQRLITYSYVFDSLAARFSDHYRKEPVTILRNMSEERIRSCRRDLLLNGVPFNELWDCMVGPWSQKGRGRWRNPLFTVENLKFIGTQVSLKDPKEKSLLHSAYLSLVEKPGPYRRPTAPGMTFLFKDQEPSKTADLQEVCADVSYNKVVLGKRSEEVLKLQENARLLLDVKAFRKDYDAAKRRKENLGSILRARYGVKPELSNFKPGQRTTVWSPREECVYYRSLEQGLRRKRAADPPDLVAQAQAKIEDNPDKWSKRPDNFKTWCNKNPWPTKNRKFTKPYSGEINKLELAQADVATKAWRKAARKRLDEYDVLARLVANYCHVDAQTTRVRGFVSIRSGFYRVINRRYQPTHFWPTYVSKKGIKPLEEEEFNPREERKLASYRKRWFKALDPETGEACDLVSLDVSSSQTQILATFLNIAWLQRLTMADPGDPEKKPFKLYLAETAWTKYRDPDDPFIFREKPEPYNWADERSRDRLIDIVKDLWMRVLYGSEPIIVVDEQRKDPETYGAGWTEYNARRLLKSCREFHVLEEFLEACRRIARRVYRNDSYVGVTFTDPLDGATVRWNPVQRFDVELGSEGRKIIVSLPGRPRPGVRIGRGQALSRGDFIHARPNQHGEYPVNPRKLRNMIAPCLVHILDAYFSSLVMERLVALGITAFAGIHDCWMVPARIRIDGEIQNGLTVLENVIREAAKEWYAGLGKTYDDFLRYLNTDPDFGHVIRRAKQRWQERMNEGYVPLFLAKEG